MANEVSIDVGLDIKGAVSELRKLNSAFDAFSKGASNSFDRVDKSVKETSS
jgi:hypothetical protein